jgi:hypothetical protein
LWFAIAFAPRERDMTVRASWRRREVQRDKILSEICGILQERMTVESDAR